MARSYATHDEAGAGMIRAKKQGQERGKECAGPFISGRTEDWGLWGNSKVIPPGVMCRLSEFDQRYILRRIGAVVCATGVLTSTVDNMSGLYSWGCFYLSHDDMKIVPW